jgi:oligopeptide transport system substrate-binding protein
LLREAGFAGGEGLPGISLLFNTSENHRTIAEAAQQMWRTELGLEVTLTNMEWKVYLDTCQAMNYDLARAGWIGSSYPYSFLRNYESTSPNNETGFADPVYDALLREARHTLDFDTRMALLREAEERLLAALPVIPIYWYKRVYLIRPEVRGWAPKFDDLRPWSLISLDGTQLEF